MYRVSLLLLLLLFAANLHGQSLSPAKDYYGSALARLDKGDVDGALNDLTKAIELKPAYVDALRARGQILFLLKRDLDAAIADYDKVLQLAPNAAGMELIYNNRSTIRQLKGDRDGALKDLNGAISLNPKHAMSYIGRGLIRAFQDDTTGAAADYEKAIELNPALTPAYINRGILRFHLGNLTGALADFNKALELHPESAKTFVERGSVKGIIGEIDEAIADIKKGFALNPESVSDKDPGYFSSPFKDLSRFIESHPTNARAYEIRGIFRLAQGKNMEAAEDFRKSLALDPKLKSEIDKAKKLAF